MKTISVVNLKGGVGKTTLASTLARLYADEGRTVLAADVDPDANLGLALGLSEEEVNSIVPVSKMKQLAKERTGFIKMMWCGDEACEIRMKEEAGVTSRCMPLEQEHLGDVCPVCGKPAKHMVYWGRQY